MTSPKAARAATAPAVSDPQNIEQLPGQLDVYASKSDLQVQYIAQRFGLTQARAALVAHPTFAGARP